MSNRTGPQAGGAQALDADVSRKSHTEDSLPGLVEHP